MYPRDISNTSQYYSIFQSARIRNVGKHVSFLMVKKGRRLSRAMNMVNAEEQNQSAVKLYSIILKHKLQLNIIYNVYSVFELKTLETPSYRRDIETKNG